MNYGTKMRDARKAKNMTQEDLAAKIGVNRATISKYESGIISPTVEQLAEIAQALDVDFSTLYSERIARIFDQVDEEALLESKFVKLFHLTLEEGYQIGKAVSRGDVTVENERDAALIEAYQKLNKTGQEIAVQRVKELGKIPEYQAEREPGDDGR